MDCSDSDLWNRTEGDDVAAFGHLFDRHAKAVYNYCFRRGADWSLAEDLTSTVFLEAGKRRRELTLQPGSGALPLLFGIAINLLRNQRRSLRRYQAALERMPSPQHNPDISDEVSQKLDDERSMRDLLCLLSRLPRVERDALTLCVWSELSYKEAAEALGVPIGTIRSRLCRARRRIDQFMGTPRYLPKSVAARQEEM